MSETSEERTKEKKIEGERGSEREEGERESVRAGERSGGGGEREREMVLSYFARAFVGLGVELYAHRLAGTDRYQMPQGQDSYTT